MADKKITDLDPIATVQPGTVFLVVDDPTGTPTNKKATASQVATAFAPAIPYPVANGGTGKTTLSAHGVIVGEGTSALAVTTPGTAGQVLTSNGASADPTFQAPVPAYVEGTWMPTITADSSGTGQVYSSQQGSYKRIGNMVVVTFYVQITAKGTLTGNIVIGGLPAVPQQWGAGTLFFVGLTTNWTNLNLMVLVGTTYLAIRGTPGGASNNNNNNLAPSDLSNSVVFQGTATYFL